jgi:broad specificity phosphatase PhoE
VDPALNREGIAQAGVLAARLQQRNVACVLSSPRTRAYQTAAIIAANCGGGEARIEPALDEIDFGEWSGRSFAELQDDPRWRRWNSHRDRTATPAGETMDDVKDRLRACLSRMQALYEGRALVLVTHAEIIRAAVFLCLGVTAANWARIDVGYASLSVLEAADWGLRLVSLNEPADYPR